eukprot:TRINITY_DN13000_c0_g2_i2.p1 TRINITY_DN13000_c0_g2~~TRINITY_DN13000_c0_g2_i2.p1  ORF type:complete len:554 (+),score=98.23 TRINITY_DN13000_c0_g2_i2:151-1812(+)
MQQLWATGRLRLCTFIALVLLRPSWGKQDAEEKDDDTSGDADGLDELEEVGIGVHNDTNCRHGVLDKKDKVCKCYDGWATAGITDTLDFLEGVCEQYHCQSDEMCQKVLNIPYATCPVKNWNCYCGFSWSLYNSLHGYETPQKEGGGECMGLMYTISVFCTESIWYVMERAWLVFMLPAVLLLPFGRKRAICDHGRQTMWNAILRCGSPGERCNGECVNRSTYSFEFFLDDIAWTVFVLDLMCWTYAFLFTAYLIAMALWSIVLWTLVILVMLMACCFALCFALGEGGTCFEDASCGSGCTGCDPGHCYCLSYMAPSNAPQGADAAFYNGGVYPVDPVFGYTGYGGYGVQDEDTQSQVSCCWVLCFPLAWLVYVIPAFPENMWGGLLGYYCFGTHAMAPEDRLYTGGNGCIDFLALSWMRRADLHARDDWRRRVRTFIESGGVAEGRGDRESLLQRDGGNGTTSVKIGNAHAILAGREFDQQADRCVTSSFEDYSKNECWICTSACDEWDLWLQCRHLYCMRCSSEMLRRRMPCPLCRVFSTAVLRGKAKAAA